MAAKRWSLNPVRPGAFSDASKLSVLLTHAGLISTVIAGVGWLLTWLDKQRCQEP
jgi:hypothetical protein